MPRRAPPSRRNVVSYDTEGSTEADEAGARSQALGAKLVLADPESGQPSGGPPGSPWLLSGMTWALVVASSLGQRAQT